MQQLLEALGWAGILFWLGVAALYMYFRIKIEIDKDRHDRDD